MSILIVHTASPSRRPHFARAREHAASLGERLILLMAEATWEGEFVDAVVPVDTASIPLTVSAARQLAAAGPEPVRGVVTFVEHSVSAAAAVAAALGLPFVSEHTARLARDKYAMRRAFAAAGIPQPHFAPARTTAEARAESERLGFPLVLKPILGGGSKYVLRVDSPDALAEHFGAIRGQSWDTFGYDPLRDSAREEYRGAVLLEQYVPGGEISVESVVQDGHTEVVAIHDKPLPMVGPSFEEVYTATPTVLPIEVQASVQRLTAAAHRALGIDSAVTHTEFRVRPDGSPSILETAARIGGGPIYRSVLLSRSVDLVEAAVDLALGREVHLLPRPEPVPIGIFDLYAKRPGRVVAFRGVDAATADPSVHEVVLYRRVGDRVDVPPHVAQSNGHVIFTAESRQRLDDACGKLAATLEVEVG
ncbi:ATP-grasp domain-containing protein [Plantactinospora sp. WMMB334]|uniref:ATP-grasp domain-containing protein n=1 Tax=Plantactinospora sp. WMMB334 TaxID=3404119 RepID=UPI003B93DA56